MMKHLKRQWIPAVIFVILASLGLYNNYGPAPKALAGFLEVFFEAKISFYYICLGLVLIYSVTAYFVQAKIDELKRANDAIKETLNNELSQATLLNREYYHYRQKDLLNVYFETYVNRHPNVQGIQLFHFEEKHLRGKVTIKVEYDFGRVYDGVNLNAMGQAYYELDPGLLKEFQKAKKALSTGYEIPMAKFVTKRAQLLVGKNGSFDEDDAVTYAYFDLGVKLLEKKLNVMYDTSPIVSAIDEIAIDTLRRTGILRAILLDNQLFTFRYKKPGEKKDRLYMGRVLKDTRGVKYLYLVIFDASILEVDNYDKEIARVEQEISREIEGMLSSRQNAVS